MNRDRLIDAIIKAGEVERDVAENIADAVYKVADIRRLYVVEHLPNDQAAMMLTRQVTEEHLLRKLADGLAQQLISNRLISVESTEDHKGKKVRAEIMIANPR